MNNMTSSVVSIISGSPEITRPAVKFVPNIWGDRFLACSSERKAIDEEYDYLKEKVRRMLLVVADDDKLDLINAVQRLGVSYHFKTELEDGLAKIYHLHHGDDDDDLYTCALRFRLLRQQGYGVSCETFNKFKDDEGNFKESLVCDVRGMLSLYEASQHSKHGEKTLDDAFVFTKRHLKKFMAITKGSSPQACWKNRVKHALNRPLHRGMPRLEAQHFLTIYEEEDSYNKTLSKFAKLDFNMLQAQHRQELSEITKWWKDLDIPTKLPYARDRLIELYFWLNGVYFEPQYGNGRLMLLKIGLMISILDDTYDAYATIDELKLLTKAIDRWDIRSVNKLPKYMKVLYGVILNTFDEIEQEIAKERRRSFCTSYVKDGLKKIARAFYEEAKWQDKKYIPTVEEYMKVSLISSAYPIIAGTSLLGMTEISDKKDFEWMFNNPKILMASSTIIRLANDLKTHQFEQERGCAASAIECYMKQYKVSKEQVVAILLKQVDDAWKDINQELLRAKNIVPAPLLERALNLARMVDVVYKDGDGYTNPAILKDYISSLFLEPVPI